MKLANNVWRADDQGCPGAGKEQFAEGSRDHVKEPQPAFGLRARLLSHQVIIVHFPILWMHHTSLLLEQAVVNCGI